MALQAAEFRGEKSLNQLPCDSVANHEAAEANQVQVVILHSLMRGEIFMDQTGTDARDLVGRHTRPHTTATGSHAAIHFSARDRAR